MLEYLAATSAVSSTGIPGPHSFTTALIWALRDLAAKGRKFNTNELVNKINDAPNFPKNQRPELSNRSGKSTAQRIMFEPISKGGTTARTVGDQASVHAPVPNVTTVLSLKFFFDERPTEENVETLGRSLNHLFQQNRLAVNRIDWGGLYPWRPTLTWAANRLIQARIVPRKLSKAGISPSRLDAFHPPRQEVHIISQGSIQDVVHDAMRHEALHREEDRIRAPSHHARMVLAESWALLASLMALSPFRSRRLRGLQGLLLLSSICIGLIAYRVQQSMFLAPEAALDGF